MNVGFFVDVVVVVFVYFGYDFLNVVPRVYEFIFIVIFEYLLFIFLYEACILGILNYDILLDVIYVIFNITGYTDFDIFLPNSFVSKMF